MPIAIMKAMYFTPCEVQNNTIEKRVWRFIEKMRGNQMITPATSTPVFPTPRAMFQEEQEQREKPKPIKSLKIKL